MILCCWIQSHSSGNEILPHFEYWPISVRQKLTQLQFFFPDLEQLVQFLNRSCGARVWSVELMTILGMVTVLGTVTIQQWLQLWRWQSRNCDSPRDGDYQRDHNYFRDGDHPRDGDHLKDCLRSLDCPRDDEYSNYGWSCRLHPYGLRNIIWCSCLKFGTDKQTDRQTETTVYRVAPQLKKDRPAWICTSVRREKCP